MQRCWRPLKPLCEHGQLPTRKRRAIFDARNGVSRAETLAREFFHRLWAPPQDLDAIDELMTEDYRIITTGKVVERRATFKAVSRSTTRGFNNGMFGLPANGEPVLGIAI